MKRKTKIVCTIGPAIDSPEMIEKIIDAGMNVARLNFSHGNHEEHKKRIEMIRSISKKLNRYIGIMADTKGPEIRTGDFKDGFQSFKKGDIVKVVSEPILGTKDAFHISSKEMFDDVQVGDYLLIDDGKMRLDIRKVSPNELECMVWNTGIIKSKKGVNIPNAKLSMPFISSKDEADIRFAVEMKVDFIALSFVRRKEDILAVKDILNKINAPQIEIIAKIENQEGVDNLDEILEVTDGIMVARGDLGVEVSTQLVPIYQKKIIQRANEMGKPVITATHMLESMMLSPRPTRAEASDVANAILDGSDAIMLSGETAAGEYPIESVLTMDTIAKAIEDTIDYEQKLTKSIKTSHPTTNDAIGIAVSQTVLALPKAEVIIAFTETGGTAKRMAKFRPGVPIIAITNNVETCQRLSYYCGVFATIGENVTDLKYHDQVAIKVAKDFGFEVGATLVITSGWGQKHGYTNTMRIIDIEE
ncbi:pyruvate kinase [Hujiaoplasma nucleasis]|uniref:Pyruvate kinase n=1 Tax=Hujiaoplasma nucleasis TaxID=2725268 RepID=A0A7L6N1L8_9MOLU|nr:pyruvate kinase [Hujiaoplasma nucleasis]QLY39471.1 pyruvate kinase [Hujiaoplasma nucleasis]